MERLQKARKSKNLTQTDIANLLGVKNNTISNYENGISEPDIDSFIKMCQTYEIDFLELLEEAYGFDIPTSTISAGEREFLKQYRCLSPKGQQVLHRITEQLIELQQPDSQEIEQILYRQQEQGTIAAYGGNPKIAEAPQDIKAVDDFLLEVEKQKNNF